MYLYLMQWDYFQDHQPVLLLVLNWDKYEYQKSRNDMVITNGIQEKICKTL